MWHRTEYRIAHSQRLSVVRGGPVARNVDLAQQIQEINLTCPSLSVAALRFKRGLDVVLSILPHILVV